jgi:hypothetical protein
VISRNRVSAWRRARAGAGAPVVGPVDALLLLTGRDAALDRLHGEGVAALAARTPG